MEILLFLSGFLLGSICEIMIINIVEKAKGVIEVKQSEKDPSESQLNFFFNGPKIADKKTKKITFLIKHL